MKKYLSIILLIVILAVIVFTSNQSVKVIRHIVVTKETKEEDKVDHDQVIIAIDPGHGGRDPGKVGVNHALEKDINLSVARKLKALLESMDIKVVMTRETDEGLYSMEDTHKKRADLDKRVELISSCKADFAISIHQNSFTEEDVKGAQVFYFAGSNEGKQLAEMIQKQIIETIGDGNHRQAKSNTSYYMLKKTQCPLVIVECGYLSNHSEAELLLKEEYQEKMAEAIQLAILHYIEDRGIKGTS